MIRKVAGALCVKVEIDVMKVAERRKAFLQLWGGGADLGEEAAQGGFPSVFLKHVKKFMHIKGIAVGVGGWL